MPLNLQTSVLNILLTIFIILSTAGIIYLNTDHIHRNIEDKDLLSILNLTLTVVGGLVIMYFGYRNIGQIKRRRKRKGLMEIGIIVSGLILLLLNITILLIDLSKEENLSSELLFIKKYFNIVFSISSLLFVSFSWFI